MCDNRLAVNKLQRVASFFYLCAYLLIGIADWTDGGSGAVICGDHELPDRRVTEPDYGCYSHEQSVQQIPRHLHDIPPAHESHGYVSFSIC